MSSQAVPARSLPEQPNLDQLRKQAKDLLKSFRAGDANAIAEVERFERHPDSTTFALADAQRVLARTYGFASWAKLKQHIEGVNVESFCAAVEAGDVAAVRKLAKAYPQLVNAQRGGGLGETTALHFAVLRRDAEMTRALMELDADARAGIWPHRDATSAHALAKDRGYDEIVAIIEEEEERRRRAMSSAGATIDSTIDEIQQAILVGRDEDAIRLLQGDKSLIGACNLRGATPLHMAAWAHAPAIARWLLERQASVDAKDGDGRTPLDYAAIVAGWSAHGRHFSLMENAEKSPALFEETVRLLRAHGAELTPLAAVAIGDGESIRQLHREGRLTNEIHRLRGGLLSIAVRVNRIDMLSLLLDLGLDPDETVMSDEGTRSSWGMPLWFTAMCGRLEMAELLLNRGVDVNAIVFASGDAMCIADETRDEAMKSILRMHGARITVERIAGEGDRETAKAILAGTVHAQSLNVVEPTPTDLAEQMLWAAGGHDAEIVRLCLPHVSRPPDDPWWNYVLMHATLPDSFQAVLDHGVDPNVRGDGGYTILHHLATKFVDQTTRIIRAKILLDAGASLQLRDPLLKSTPLGWACRWGRRDLVQLYLDRGVDPREPDAESWATPLAWAVKGEHTDLVQLLRSHGVE